MFKLDHSKNLLFGKGLNSHHPQHHLNRGFCGKWLSFKFDKNGNKFLKRKLMLVMSNFSFSHSVFKRRVRQTHKNQGLYGKGLSTISICERANTCKGVTPITHNTQVRYVKKVENSSIDLLRGQNSWSKSCKFHCFINFADKKGFQNTVKQCFKRGSDCIYWHPRC